MIPWADKVYVMDKGRLITQGAPREIGEVLKREHHGMFLSMPVPMQIYAEVESDLPWSSDCKGRAETGSHRLCRMQKKNKPVSRQRNPEKEWGAGF